MEYETFINSAYLQQGRADEFTRQRPADRKRILGEILGLERYDKLEAKAKVLMNERKEEAAELDREINAAEKGNERACRSIRRRWKRPARPWRKSKRNIAAQEKTAAGMARTAQQSGSGGKFGAGFRGADSAD